MAGEADQKAFVAGFTYDVFVSYAQIDDIPDIDFQPGWVTNLVQKLSSRFAQQLGGREVFKIWMDRKQDDGLGGRTNRFRKRSRAHWKARPLWF